MMLSLKAKVLWNLQVCLKETEKVILMGSMTFSKKYGIGFQICLDSLSSFYLPRH